MGFLIEPFTPYQEPPRKKHWTELLEEEYLYYKIRESLEANKNLFTKDSRTFLLSKDDGDSPNLAPRGRNHTSSSF